MKLLLLLLGLVTLTAAQFRRSQFSPRRSFVVLDDDDFDDFFDFDDHDDDDSLEDLYEDLYDDDADDRAEARAKLTRLRASGAITGPSFRNSRFLPSSSSRRNTGFRQGSVGNRRFNSGGSQRFSGQRSSTSFFPTQRPTPRTPRPTFSSSSSPSRFGSSTLAPARFSQNRFTSPTFAPKRTFSSPSRKFNSGSSSGSFNTINTGSSRKTTSTSPFKATTGGRPWPGGNGYFFSMSTNGAKPVTYFIRYDD